MTAFIIRFSNFLVHLFLIYILWVVVGNVKVLDKTLKYNISK